MSNLKPLKWIDVTAGFNGIYIADTDSYIVNAVAYCHTLVTDYVISKRDDKFAVNYGGRTINEYDTLQDAKDWCEFTHYKDKMQPYVKPHVGWISVDDRLPAMYERVLIKSNCILVAGRQSKSEYNKDWGIKGDWMWVIVNDSWCNADMVTHWMPLPKLPSEATR